MTWHIHTLGIHVKDAHSIRGLKRYSSYRWHWSQQTSTATKSIMSIIVNCSTYGVGTHRFLLSTGSDAIDDVTPFDENVYYTRVWSRRSTENAQNSTEADLDTQWWWKERYGMKSNFDNKVSTFLYKGLNITPAFPVFSLLNNIMNPSIKYNLLAIPSIRNEICFYLLYLGLWKAIICPFCITLTTILKKSNQCSIFLRHHWMFTWASVLETIMPGCKNGLQSIFHY